MMNEYPPKAPALIPKLISDYQPLDGELRLGGSAETRMFPASRRGTLALWVAHRGGPKANAPASNPEEAYAQICDWNRRKENLCIREHIGVVWGVGVDELNRIK